MLLFRCAWHRQYRGYPMVYGVGSWRGAPVRFSDGICDRCARRQRAESRMGRRGVATPLIPRGMPRVGVALALALATVFTARPVSHAPDFRIVRTSVHHQLTALNDTAPSVSIKTETARTEIAKTETTSTPSSAATSVARLIGDPPRPTRTVARRPAHAASTRATTRIAGNNVPANRREVAANRSLATKPPTQSPLTASAIPALIPDVEPRRLPFAWLWTRLQELPSAKAVQAPGALAALQSP